MWYDLQTLLALWVGVDVVIGLTFLAQHRRLPAIGGPGWWALAALGHIVASSVMLLRPALPPVLGIPLSNVLLSLPFALMWLGYRAHMGLPVRAIAWALVPGVLALALVFAYLVAVIDNQVARQVIWAASNVLYLGLFLREVLLHRPVDAAAESRALIWLLCVELAGMGLYLVLALVYAWPLPSLAGLMVFYYLLAHLVHALVFHSLVIQRLRREADAARAAQRQREADLGHLLDHLDAGVIVFRPDHTVWRMNAAARRFLGHEDIAQGGLLAEPVPITWRMFGDDGEPLRLHDQPFERVLVTGRPVRDLIVGLRLEDGSRTRWALCSAYPENDAHGGLRSVVLTFIDITDMRAAQAEQKALEARLAQSQKMQALGTLAGGIAHDFNNILAAILGNADLAREDLAPGARAHESLGEISTAARRGRELVRQILAFSRQQPLARQRLQLAGVVAESCALLRAALPPQLQLVQALGENVPEICADPTQLQQVLVNLGTNAVHAMQGRSGRVTFTLDTQPPHDTGLPPELAQACAEAGLPAVRLRVSDEGCGMDEPVLRRVFEPFFTTKPVGQGTGLGLPVVLGIVEAHGGHIGLSSRTGEGTTVTLLFPPANTAADTPAAKPVTMNRVDTPPAARTEADDGHAPHVLYLDDDDTLVFLVRRLLERRGYRVTAVGLQEEALSLVRERPGHYALLLTDYNMPGMSGLEVARAALAADPTLTVAVASGYITDELQAEAQAAGVREVVFKTDAVDQFCEIVARLVNPAAGA